MKHATCPRCGRPAETGRDRWGAYVCCLVCGTIEPSSPPPPYLFDEDGEQKQRRQRQPSHGGGKL